MGLRLISVHLTNINIIFQLQSNFVKAAYHASYIYNGYVDGNGIVVNIDATYYGGCIY